MHIDPTAQSSPIRLERLISAVVYAEDSSYTPKNIYPSKLKDFQGLGQHTLDISQGNYQEENFVQKVETMYLRERERERLIKIVYLSGYF